MSLRFRYRRRGSYTLPTWLITQLEVGSVRSAETMDMVNRFVQRFLVLFEVIRKPSTVSLLDRSKILRGPVFWFSVFSAFTQ